MVENQAEIWDHAIQESSPLKSAVLRTVFTEVTEIMVELWKSST